MQHWCKKDYSLRSTHHNAIRLGYQQSNKKKTTQKLTYSQLIFFPYHNFDNVWIRQASYLASCPLISLAIPNWITLLYFNQFSGVSIRFLHHLTVEYEKCFNNVYVHFTEQVPNGLSIDSTYQLSRIWTWQFSL